MEINLVKGARKRESCFFYRRDTIKGVYRTLVCEKTNFKKPSLLKCTACVAYTPYLSISELAKREKERYNHFLKRPQAKDCINCGKSIKTNNSNINRCRTNCNTLLAFIDDKTNQTKEINLPKKIIQKQLC